jgi:hypothetical protein
VFDVLLITAFHGECGILRPLRDRPERQARHGTTERPGTLRGGWPPVGAVTRRAARSGRKAQPNALDTTEVREWAKAQGIDVKDRGRVPAELVVKFKAATGQ